MIKRLIGIAALLLMLAACTDTAPERAGRDMHFLVTTFRSSSGWAYAIYIDGKEYIRQLYIPAVEGQHPFTDEAAARKTGLFVMEKLKHKKSPGLTREELAQLRVMPVAGIQ